MLHNLSMCICSLRYPSCNAHAPYCHLWSAPLYNTFSTCSHKRQHFRGGGKLLSTKCVFWLSLKRVSEIFLILRINERYMIKKLYIYMSVFIQSTIYCCQILIKIQLSGQIFKKSSNIKFHENPPSWSRAVPCGRTDGQA